MRSLGADLWFYGETHLRMDELLALQRRMAIHDWGIVACPAVPSTSSLTGTLGGVAGGFKNHLASIPMNTDVRNQGLDMSKATDIVGRGLSLRGGDIIFAGGYCREGLVEDKFRKLAEWTSGGFHPFVFAADFNIPFDVIAQSPWLSVLKAHARKPSSVDGISCHQGEGSMIDYFIVSDVLKDYVKECWVVKTVPSGPHDGIAMTIHADPRAATMTVRVDKAKEFAAATQDISCGPLGLAAAKWTWPEAYAKASRDTEPNVYDRHLLPGRERRDLQPWLREQF